MRQFLECLAKPRPYVSGGCLLFAAIGAIAVLSTRMGSAVAQSAPEWAQSELDQARRRTEALIDRANFSAANPTSQPVISATKTPADLPSKYHILAVGVSKYRLHDANLHGAANDAKQVVELFGKQGKPVRVIQLVDEQATKAAILAAFKRLVADVASSQHDWHDTTPECVIIYMSGHGSRAAGHWYFLPHDYSPTNSDGSAPDIFGNVRANGISDEDLASTVWSLGAGHRQPRVIVMIDSCFAGNIADRLITVNLSLGDNFTLLLSSIPSQMSYDGADNSIFTRALLEGLRGWADRNEDGTVSLRELRYFIHWRVKDIFQRSNAMPGMGLPEQNSICESGLDFDEKSALTATSDNIPSKLIYVNRWEMQKRFDEAYEFVHGHREDPITAMFLVGRWRGTISPSNMSGTPADAKNELEYALELRGDGTYDAAVRNHRNEVASTRGTYHYRSGLAPSIRQRELGGPNEDPFDWLTLEYGNGSDLIKLRILSDGPKSLPTNLQLITNGDRQRSIVLRPALPNPAGR